MANGHLVPIHERVIVCWGQNPHADNLFFLDSLAPVHFRVIATAVKGIEGDKEEQYAAMQIRMMRDQAAEMLFALLASAIQSPHGVALWVLSYRNDELDAVVGGFGRSVEIRTERGKRKCDWDSVVAEVTKHFTSNAPDMLEKYRRRVAGFLSRLASDFLDPLTRREYASLKHGLRARPGGCTITLTPERSLGVADENASPTVLEGSGFGSSFYVPERIASHKHYFRLVHHHRHWSPDVLFLQIELIVNTIQNVIAHLSIINGKPPPLPWSRPADESLFDECWRVKGVLLNSSMCTVSGDVELPALSEDELRRLCDEERQE